MKTLSVASLTEATETSYNYSVKYAKAEFERQLAKLTAQKEQTERCLKILANNEAEINELLSNNNLTFEATTTLLSTEGLRVTGTLKMVGRNPWKTEKKNNELVHKIEEYCRNHFSNIYIYINQYSLTHKNNIIFNIHVVQS